MVPESDEKAVMEALYSRGPLAVSLDASHKSFSFYASGGPAPFTAIRKHKTGKRSSRLGFGTFTFSEVYPSAVRVGCKQL